MNNDEKENIPQLSPSLLDKIHQENTSYTSDIPRLPKNISLGEPPRTKCEWSSVDNLLDKPQLRRRWIGCDFPNSNPMFFQNGSGSSESKTVLFPKEEDTEFKKLKKEINNLKLTNFLLFVSNIGIGLILLYKY